LILEVNEAQEWRDHGDYKCTITDYYNNSNNAIATMKFVSGPTLELNFTNPKIVTNKGKKVVRFLIDYIALPPALFTWYNPNGEEIANNNELTRNVDKYDVEITHNHIKFSIKHPEISDFGDYTLVANNGDGDVVRKVHLTVSEKPFCEMNDIYVMDGSDAELKCKCLAYPPAEVTCSYKPCEDLLSWPDCKKNNRKRDQYVSY
jgi:hypothetical protein